MPDIMLVSHRKKFIYTKTAKTAGTSVESYFEPFCLPEGDWKLEHTRDDAQFQRRVVHRLPGREAAEGHEVV